MRYYILLCFIALLSGQFPQAAMAQEETLTLPKEVDKGALACTWTLLVMARDFQRYCHPEDEASGRKLDKPIAQLEAFFPKNNWYNQNEIDYLHAPFAKLQENFKEHPLKTREGTVSNVCDYKDLQRTYQLLLAESEDRKLAIAVANMIADPPLRKTPGGTVCF